MLTVACVLKSGGIYTPEWVGKLQRGVAANMKFPHRFVCLSDMDVPCERIPLHHGWPGWWSKIEAYRLPGPVLYLDLDVAVVGPLDALLTAETTPFDGRTFADAGGMNFAAPRDWWRPRQVNTSVVLFRDCLRIYEAFAVHAAEIMAAWRGDQEWISDTFPMARVWPAGLAVSFKRDCRSRLGTTMPPPKGASVVCFHGQPKMPDAKGWPQEMWAA